MNCFENTFLILILQEIILLFNSVNMKYKTKFIIIFNHNHNPTWTPLLKR